MSHYEITTPQTYAQFRERGKALGITMPQTAGAGPIVIRGYQILAAKVERDGRYLVNLSMRIRKSDSIAPELSDQFRTALSGWGIHTACAENAITVANCELTQMGGTDCPEQELKLYFKRHLPQEEPK